jgi:glyoxylase-like metal-dependent hydrolase (beta-lactamase superfamily II)
VSDAQMNVQGAALTVPDNVLQAKIPPVRVDAQKMADGVWFMAGGSHNSVAIEFKDYVAVIEAPLNEERSLAVIAEINKLIPNKKIKYVVNTHHHFDHLGGVRTYAAEGATIITHESHRQFFQQIVFAPQPRTLEPDRLSLFPPATTGPIPVYFETMTENYALSDGVRSVLLHAFRTNHVGAMIIAYLPKEKILVEADLYTPAAEGAQPAPPNPNSIALYREVKKMKWDADTIAPLHGRKVPMQEFESIIGPAANRRSGGAE